MENYELAPDKIISWAVNYSTYEELEEAAKALYGIYALRRKREHPTIHQKAKQYRKQLRGRL